MALNVILAGVGGNGVVLVSRILARAASLDGFGVRLGEKHGLAQRGGTVVSHLRLCGKNKCEKIGVIIPKGSGDVLLGFEPLEALRCLELMKPKGCAIVNSEAHLSVSDLIGLTTYPKADEVFGLLDGALSLKKIDAGSIAEKAGHSSAMNMVMLGALCASGVLPIKRETLETAISGNVPKLTESLNLAAFHAGCALSPL